MDILKKGMMFIAKGKPMARKIIEHTVFYIVFHEPLNTLIAFLQGPQS